MIGSESVDIDEITRKLKEAREKGYKEYINVDGARIRYAAKGSGPAVVLLHGLGGFLETWGLNIFPLSERYRVYALDLPGHGLSDRLKNCYTFDCASKFLVSIMEVLGIEHAALIGHSLGGAISIHAAVNFPRKIDRLILVSSAGLSQWVPLPYRLYSIPLLGRIMMKRTKEILLHRGIKHWLYNPDALSEEILDMLLTTSHGLLTGEDLLNLARHNVSLGGLRPEALMTGKLPLIRVPTLFIHGAQDTVFPLERVKKSFGLVSNARAEIFEECGHLPHVEKATQFNDVVLTFLQAV